MKEKELKDILRKGFNFEENWKPLFSLLFNKVEYFSKPSNPFSENAKVKSGKQTGVVKLDDGKTLAIFEVEVDDCLHIARNRKGLREIAIKHIDQNITHGAFVFFYSKNQLDYRFSFIAKWSEIDLDTGEFIKGETKPKRYTYLLGGNEACTTAASRLLILSSKNVNIGISDILDAFSVDALTKEFYNELSNWYFWALQNVKFPDDFEPDDEVRNATSIIRLITRLIFVWFLKQKGLIPDGLFDEKELKQILNYSDKTGSTYYKAILQNLFFATLNTGMTDDKRKFINRQYGVQGFYRYERFFNNKERFLELTRNIPFLNGGLFENLDKNVGEVNEIRIDCFSNKAANENRLSFPDYLFFEGGEHADLNRAYGDSTHGNLKVRGLIEILKSYNFTIEENTPYEIEIALDPELLGKVFENLLASYNPETKTTARKQTGSFYTPRAIVNYMVDESILAYLKNKLLYDAIGKEDELEENLRLLLSYSSEENPFDTNNTVTLLKAIDNCKILDPACGSGAFPMGVLQKMVHILQKLDKDNNLWRDLQRQKAIADTESAYNIGDKNERQRRLIDIDETFDYNASDYGRKLYLIENCIYGLDIQPIAVQIAKLRFFISLVCDQKTNNKRENLGIRPLPNLETKFVAANSLIGLNKQGGILRIPEVAFKESELTEIRHKHFSARSPETKKKYRQIDNLLREEIALIIINETKKHIKEKEILLERKQSELIQSKKAIQLLKIEKEKNRYQKRLVTLENELALLKEAIQTPETIDQTAHLLSDWNPYDQNISAHFFDTEWMFGLMEGFDIVIGNPPYLRIQGVQEATPALIPYAKKHYMSAQKGNWDLYVLFTEAGFKMLNPKGILSFIQPHKFFQGDFGVGIRNYIAKEKCLYQIVHFGAEQMFESATNYTCLFFIQKLVQKTFKYIKVDKPDEWLHNTDSAPEYILPQPEKDQKWSFTSGEKQNILDKLKQQSQTLGDIVRKIFQGIATSSDKIYVLKIKEWKEKTVVLLSVSLDTEVEIEIGLIKPFLMGKDVKRYEKPEPISVVIFPYLIKENKASLMQQVYIKEHFPLGWQYLLDNRIELENREKGRMKHENFYAYIYPKNLVEFDTIKIITPDIANHPKFTIDTNFNYHTTTIYSFSFKEIGVSEKFEYWLGLFNSKLMWFFLQSTGNVLRGGFFRFKTEYLKPFPIKRIDFKNKNETFCYNKIIDNVNNILDLKESGKDTFRLEAEIDAIVFILYAFTEDEMLTTLLQMPDVSEAERREIQFNYKEYNR